MHPRSPDSRLPCELHHFAPPSRSQPSSHADFHTPPLPPPRKASQGGTDSNLQQVVSTGQGRHLADRIEITSMYKYGSFLSLQRFLRHQNMITFHHAEVLILKQRQRGGGGQQRRRRRQGQGQGQR